MIDRIEISMTNGSVHNFRRGEFGVKDIIINEGRGIVEITYFKQEIGDKIVIIPFQNVEKIEFLEKNAEE